MTAKQEISSKLRGIGSKTFADRIVSSLKTNENINNIAAYLSAHPNANKTDVLEFAEYEKENIEMPR